MRHPILLLCLVMALYSCRKKDAPSSSGPGETFNENINIVYFGDMYIGAKITFACNLPEGSTLTWDFGDSTTGNEKTTEHYYYNSGQYIVTLKSHNVVFDTVHINISYGLQRISTMRKWTKRHYEQESDLGQTWYDWEKTADTNFALALTSDNKIIIPKGDTLANFANPVALSLNPYMGTGIFVFQAKSGAPHYTDEIVLYDIKKDSISIVLESQHPMTERTYFCRFDSKK